MARSLVQSYLQGEAKELFPLHPGSPADRRGAVTAALRPLAPEVAEELEAQNARFAPCPAREANLRALRQGAAAVVTGQQVGLFLGPLYTLYKAAAAIRVARSLSEECGVPVVPIFWLQTEDHDLPEIASCTIATSAGELLKLQLPADDGRISIAHRKLPTEIESLLNSLRGELEDRSHGAAHLEWLASHWRPGAGWGESFGGAIASLFAEEGLVVVDPRTPAIARAGRELHRRALEEAAPIAEGLRERSRRLREADLPVAVHVREGAPLAFFHPDGPEASRYRLDAELAEVGGQGRHHLDELLAILDAEPLRFSTSALLRPLLQDSLLPTAAYVGGPGELAYFAQLAPVYEAFDKAMPLFVHRSRFVVVEPRARRLLHRLGLETADVAASEDSLLARCAPPELADGESLAASLLGPLEASLELAAAPMRGELERSLARTRTSLRVAVTRFARRYELARLRRDSTLVEDVRKLQRLLHPEGGPQERLHGLPHYAARYGARDFVRAIVAAAEPFDASLREIEP